MLQKQKKARIKLYVEQRMQDFIKRNNLKKIEKTITVFELQRKTYYALKFVKSCTLLMPYDSEKEKELITEYYNERLKIAYSYIITLNK